MAYSRALLRGEKKAGDRPQFMVTPVINVSANGWRRETTTNRVTDVEFYSLVTSTCRPCALLIFEQHNRHQFYASRDTTVNIMRRRQQDTVHIYAQCK